MCRIRVLVVTAVALASAGCQSGLRHPANYGLMMPPSEVGNRAEFYRLVDGAAPRVDEAIVEMNARPAPSSESETQAQKKEGQSPYQVAATLAVDALDVGQRAVTRYEFYVRLALTGLDSETQEGRKAAQGIAKAFKAAQKKLDSAAREGDADDKLEEAGKMLASLGELARRLDHAFHYLKDRPDATPNVQKVLGFFQDDLAEGMKVFVELGGFISTELAVLEANGERGESGLGKFTSVAANFAGAFPGGDYISTGVRVVRGFHAPRAVVVPAGTVVGAHADVARFGARCVHYRRYCEPYHRVIRGCGLRGTTIAVGVAVERGSSTSVGVGVNVRR